MNFAIIVAAGKSRRIEKGINKIFFQLMNKPLIYYTIKAFQDCNLIEDITIVAQKKDFKKILDIKNFFVLNKIKNIVKGGNERQKSVYNGLNSIKNAENEDIIVVHNGSNPLVKTNEIEDCINSARIYGAAVVGFPLKDTIKKINNDFVERTIERKNIYQIQTPQAIKYGIFVEAFRNAKRKKLKVTDDVSLVEALDKKVKIVQCSYENIKITTKDDLKIAEGILMKRNNLNNFRIGFGQDSHKFSKNKNKKLTIGGYVIPNEIGLEANSDGDIVLHALFNAVSSAIGERSLGFYADGMYKREVADSKAYLEIILNKMKERNFSINNVSISIEAKRPKLEQYSDTIKGSLSRILKISVEKIGITYTSGEGLTPFGQEKGMQCFVITSLLDFNNKQ